MVNGEWLNWDSIKGVSFLVDSLERFLVRVFGEDYINDQFSKLKAKPKGRLEQLRYIVEPNVHRVAVWWNIIQSFKERGYSFDLGFSADVEGFMELMLFTYAFNLLLDSKVLALDDSRVLGKLRDRDNFSSLLYETLIASNYVSNGFHVEVPDLVSSAGRMPDIFAKKGELKVYGECKSLERNERYGEIAVELGSWLYDKKVNCILDITLPHTPRREDKDYVRKIIELAVRAAEEEKAVEGDGIKVLFQKLPELMHNPPPLSVPRPEDIEYVLSSSYFGLFADGFKVKEPKIIILRNLNKLDELVNRLKDRLKDAYSQLEAAGDGHKVIYVDVSKVVGKPVLQLPESLSVKVGPELLLGKLESFIRSWLEEHPKVDGIVLTEPKLYLDSIGTPYTIALEQKSISSYIAPGWTIEVPLIQVPEHITPEELVNVGVELAKRGHHNMALSCYRKAIEINPNLKEAYNNLGRLLIENGRVDEALTYLDKVLKLDPNYVSALVNKGILLATLGKYEEALDLFEKSVRLEPDSEKAWYNKAMIHYVLGEYDKARESIDKALNINPRYMPAQRLKCELERV